MRRKRMTIAIAAVLALATLGGVAVAKSSGSAPSAPRTAEVSVDTDNIQEGDQTDRKSVV